MFTYVVKVITNKWVLLALAIILIISVSVPFIIEAKVRSTICEEMGKYMGDANITRIAISDISWTTVTIEVTVNVHNPNSRGAVVDKMEYDLYYQTVDDWEYLGVANKNEDISISPYESANVTVSNKIWLPSAIGMLFQSFEQGGPIMIKAVGIIWIKVGPMSIDVPFEHIQNITEL